MSLRPNGYRDRLIDETLLADLATFGAVSVEGPKWCGKTWACLNHCESALYLMDPAGNFAGRRLALIEPSAAIEGDHPRLLDEWQEAPGLWDAVRFHIDQSHARGLFMLTGSTRLRTTVVRHSGTGRIVTRRMRPMILFESDDSSGGVSLSGVLAGEGIRPAMSEMSLGRLIDFVCRGGWPEVTTMDTAQARSVARSYLDHIAEEDVSLPDNVERDPVRVRALLASLARNTATLVQIPTLRRDMAQSFDASATDPTIRSYLESLQALYVLEEIPAWSPHLRSSAVLRKSPKRMLCDPSLAVAALGATPATLKADLNTFGFLFEALCLRDLLVLAEHCGAQVSHYRDDSGLEADAVLTLPDGSWAGFEVKLGSADEDSAAAHLLALSSKLQKGGHSAPVALCVIVGVAGVARTRPDGVHVVPIDHLGP